MLVLGLTNGCLRAYNNQPARKIVKTTDLTKTNITQPQISESSLQEYFEKTQFDNVGNDNEINDFCDPVNQTKLDMQDLLKTIEDNRKYFKVYKNKKGILKNIVGENNKITFDGDSKFVLRPIPQLGKLFNKHIYFYGVTEMKIPTVT